MQHINSNVILAHAHGGQLSEQAPLPTSRAEIDHQRQDGNRKGVGLHQVVQGHGLVSVVLIGEWGCLARSGLPSLGTCALHMFSIRYGRTARKTSSAQERMVKHRCEEEIRLAERSSDTDGRPVCAYEHSVRG